MIYDRSWKHQTRCNYRVTYKNSRGTTTTRTGSLMFAGPKAMVFHKLVTGATFRVPTPDILKMERCEHDLF